MNSYRVTLKIGLINIFFLITEVISEDEKVVKAIESIKENIQDLKTDSGIPYSAQNLLQQLKKVAAREILTIS